MSLASSRRLIRAGALFAVAATLAVRATDRENRTRPGELFVEPPTLINLGFEWVVDGDDNRNAKVEVSYRKQGEREWKQAMPLLRLQREPIFQPPGVWNVESPNMFAGSILDLTPDTAYEARFVLSDPDGLIGETSATVTKLVSVHTRPEPRPAQGGRVFHVYPQGFKGQMMEPAFNDIMCAYNYSCGGGDTVAAARTRVRPGDIVLVHAGLYKYHPEYYGDRTLNATTPLEGTYYLNGSGTADRPIVIKAAGDGEVILDGNGTFNLINVKAGDYNYFEGLTIRNTKIGIWAGTQFHLGSKGLTVKHCRFENVGIGVYTNYSGSTNFYIADNEFIGGNDPNHMLGWSGNFWAQYKGIEGQAYPPTIDAYTAVRLYGSGHVVAYNYVTGYHDGIDIETYGNPDGSDPFEGPKYPPRQLWDRRPVAIDFYNNYMNNFHDNAFEIDGSMHNIRVMRNLVLNSASQPFCNQPSVGGPIYWIRNIAYHAPGGAARVSSGSPGVLFYNNTILTEFSGGQNSNMHLRNNLILGEGASQMIFNMTTYTNYSSSDYNGFRPNPDAANAFGWNSPPWNVVADFSSLLRAGGMGQQGNLAPTQSRAGNAPQLGTPGATPIKIGAGGFGGDGPVPPAGARQQDASVQSRRFKTLAEYSAATHQDTHSVLVDYGIFVNVPRLDANDLYKIQKVHKAEDLDFNLKPDSAAVDRGALLPNITDGFTGKAPDLGALEFGQAQPHRSEEVTLADAALLPPNRLRCRASAESGSFCEMIFHFLSHLTPRSEAGQACEESRSWRVS